MSESDPAPLRTAGVVTELVEEFDVTDTTCAIADCGYPTRWQDLCNAHSVRLLRTGERGGPVRRRGPKAAKLCGADRCTSPHYCGGYCTRHYQQIQKRGAIEPPRITGAEHASWQGDEITYRTAHNRVEGAYGPARSRVCIDCSSPADHWSYNHTDMDEKVSDGGQPYSTDVTNYSPRCVPCHKRFDLARIDAMPVR